MKPNFNRNLTNSALIAAATGLASLQLPAAEATVSDLKPVSDGISFRVDLPQSRFYSVGFSSNLREWYARPLEKNDGATNFTSIEKLTSANSGFVMLKTSSEKWDERTTWVRRFDEASVMRVEKTGGTQILQKKDIKTEVVQNVATLQAGQGEFLSFGVCDNWLAYTIAGAAQTNQTFIKRLTEPQSEYVVEGELCRITKYSNERYEFSIKRNFAETNSGFYYEKNYDMMSLNGADFELRSGAESISGTNLAWFSMKKVVAAIVEEEATNDCFNARARVWRIKNGMAEAQLLFDQVIGTYPKGSKMAIHMPDKWGTNLCIAYTPKNLAIAETTVVDPLQNRSIKVNINSYPNYYYHIYDANQLGIFGLGDLGQYAEAWLDLNSFQMLPARTLPTSALCLTDFDGVSAVECRTVSDGSLSSSIFPSQGLGASAALKVDFQKSDSPESYLEFPLSDASCDLSKYKSLSLWVKNLETEPLKLTMRFYAPCTSYAVAVCGTYEETLSVTNADWTKLTFKMPQDGRMALAYQARCLDIIPAAGQAQAKGSFLIDNITLEVE